MPYSNPLPLSIRVERSGLSMSSGQFFVYCGTNKAAKALKAEYTARGVYHKSGRAAMTALVAIRDEVK